MARFDRQKIIKDIVGNSEIETQYELTTSLKERGFNVTQATISRDIKELGLIKILSKDKSKSCYSLPQDDKFTKLQNLFQHSVININSAENLIVIKTISGAANSACTFIDKIGFEEIIGSVAGDDTIIVVIKDKKSTKFIVDKLNNILK